MPQCDEELELGPRVTRSDSTLKSWRKNTRKAVFRRDQTGPAKLVLSDLPHSSIYPFACRPLRPTHCPQRTHASKDVRVNQASPFAHIMLICLVAVAVLFTNLGGPRLWDRDEPRNAGCAREMLERGDWVTPVFNGELRNHKPVLLYWLIMSAYTVFGVNEFAARFWSAAASTGTVLFTYAIGRHLFTARAGLWAALALATSLMFDVAARAATPDALLIFCTTLGLFVFVRWSLPGADAALGQTTRGALAVANTSAQFPRSGVHAAMIYGSFALGVLAKGPVALVLPVAIMGAYLLLAHRTQVNWREAGIRAWIWKLPRYFFWTCWRMRPLTALLMLLVVAVPWYVWVGVRTDGRFLWEFFVEHNLNRARQPLEGHQGPFFYYMVAVLPGFFPWSVFLVPTMWESISVLRRRNGSSAGVLFCAVWIFVWIGAFSLAGTKLPSYVTPCYPALALLTGVFLDQWIAKKTTVPIVWPRFALGVLAAVGVILLVALPLVAQHYLPNEQWLALAGCVPLLGAATAGMYLRSQRTKAAVTTIGVSAALFCVAMFAVVAQRVDRYQHNDRLLRAVQARGANAELGAFGCLEPTWVFYGNRHVEVLSDVNGYLAEHHERFVITTRRHLAEIENQLPAAVSVLEEAPYFLKDEQLVLLGYPDEVRTASRP